jgi:hypothetical protein
MVCLAHYSRSRFGLSKVTKWSIRSVSIFELPLGHRLALRLCWSSTLSSAIHGRRQPTRPVGDGALNPSDVQPVETVQTLAALARVVDG